MWAPRRVCAQLTAARAMGTLSSLPRCCCLPLLGLCKAAKLPEGGGQTKVLSGLVLSSSVT